MKKSDLERLKERIEKEIEVIGYSEERFDNGYQSALQDVLDWIGEIENEKKDKTED